MGFALSSSSKGVLGNSIDGMERRKVLEEMGEIDAMDEIDVN